MGVVNQYFPESVTHPGEILKELLLENGMGSKELAVKTGKPEKTISEILNGKSGITPAMAIAIEQVLKVPVKFWLSAQKNFDEYKARIAFQSEIEAAKDWAKSFPYAKMASLDWLPKTRKIEEKVINLFNYFEIATKSAFENYYYNRKIQAAFRLSLANQENALAIAAWLRHGEIQARKFEVDKYDSKRLKKALPLIKEVMVRQPKDFFSELKELCSMAGVKLVYTPCLPKAAIHGCTRWLGDVPLIQLSGRQKRNDIFWFTFFHEIAHILKHGKKYISIENIEIEGEKQELEREADEFAAEWLLSTKEEQEILNNTPIGEDEVIHYAQKFGTHPACIIGRFQHKGLIPHGIGNNLFERIEIQE